MKAINIIAAVLLLSLNAGAQTPLRWPVQVTNEYSEVNDFYIVNNYLDRDNTSGFSEWNCGNRTYDTHRGIDIDIWPFHWSMMDNNYVMAVAAAPGRVVEVVDNNGNENNCGSGPYANVNWNHITIRHADSSSTIYGHIRDGSAMVTAGQMVTEGQALAFIGSSGRSSNPHLHFEVNSTPVNDSQLSGLVDPFNGPCNNGASWWQSQKPYREPAIVRVMTHFTTPRLPGINGNNDYCRTGESKNAKAAFVPNDSIYFGVAMRDFLQSSSHSFTITVNNPDGSQWFSQNQSSNAEYESVYYVFRNRLPSNAQSGTYKVIVSFNGSTGVYFFSVNCPASQNVSGIHNGTDGYKSSSTITSTAIIPSGSRMLLQAASRITLSPGFRSQTGSALKARIRDCNYSE